MKILELFSGTASFSKVAIARGHECRTVDIELRFDPTYRRDILTWIPEKDLNGWKPDIIWASPPCQRFSTANYGIVRKHWQYPELIPKSEEARKAIECVKKTISIIKEINPMFFIVENPHALLGKTELMKGIEKKTVDYCQYGSKFQKPTDLWTNIVFTERPRCKRLHHHEEINRNWISAKELGVVPSLLCEEILVACESQEMKE